MERKRDGLVPIGESFSGLDGPVKALRDASPARHSTASPASIRWTSLSGPAKRTPIRASWRGYWRCAAYPAATPATGTSPKISESGCGSHS